MKHPQLWIVPVSFFVFSEVSATKLKFVKVIRIPFGTLYLTKYFSYVKIVFRHISLIVRDGKGNVKKKKEAALDKNFIRIKRTDKKHISVKRKFSYIVHSPTNALFIQLGKV